MKWWPGRLARIAEIIIGVTYLVAALMKAQDFNAFLPQIHAYQIVSSNAGLIVIAFAALALETGLGLCMVIGTPWRRAVLGLSAAMLCFFTGVIIYAWAVHGLEDCGCFGKVKVTPPQAIGKNVLILALNAVAYYGLVMRGEGLPAPRRGFLRVAVSSLLAIGVCIAVVPQLGILDAPVNAPEAGESGAENPASGPFTGIVVESEYGDTFDLGAGDYLVALLSMTCDHCMESVPRLNEFTFDTTLPPLVAICLEPEVGSMEEFKLMTQPQFPMRSLGDKGLNFYPLLETASSPPRLVYVRDGATVQSWDGEMPDYEALHAALLEAGYARAAQPE